MSPAATFVTCGSLLGTRRATSFRPSAFGHSLDTRSCRHPTITHSHNRRRPLSMVVDDSAATEAPKGTAIHEAQEALMKEQLYAYFEVGNDKSETRLAGAGKLAADNFATELRELVGVVRRGIGLDAPSRFSPPMCLNLQLSNDAVAEREREVERIEGRVQVAPWARFIYDVTCRFLDFRFNGRPVERFWCLETVARIPYYAQGSCLHLWSTLGWWRSPTLMNMHHAEELNESYHLAVMESLGGDRAWGDRFFAFHGSIAYYWFLVLLFTVSPRDGYAFTELIERHAVDTYAVFVEANESRLKALPAPPVSDEYYTSFRYYFEEFQLSSDKGGEAAREIRRPEINSLYDVFVNILEDEKEHCKTMTACGDYINDGRPIEFNGRTVSGKARQQNRLSDEKRQAFWRRWAEVHERAEMTESGTKTTVNERES